MFDTDVFVVGGGPAGIAAALAARKHGLRVTMADAGKPPLDKACGEGLMPDTLAAAVRLGIEIPEDAGFAFRGIRFIGESGQSAAALFPSGAGLGVRRTRLHQLLVTAAERAGVRQLWGEAVTGLDGHSVMLRSGQVTSQWIVGADGGQSAVRQWAHLNNPTPRSRRYAYRRHFAIEPWTDHVEVYWGDGCQIYVTPVAEREVGLALVSRLPDLRLDDALQRFFPSLNRRLAGVLKNSRERGAMTGCLTLRAVTQGNVALIGDASGSVDAITGEGICLSFQQAEVLGAAMSSGRLRDYNRAHPWLALRPQLMAQGLLLLDRNPRIRHAVLSLFGVQPWIFQKLLSLHIKSASGT